MIRDWGGQEEGGAAVCRVPSYHSDQPFKGNGDSQRGEVVNVGMDIGLVKVAAIPDFNFSSWSNLCHNTWVIAMC